jgi:hypothetical protein
MDRLGKIRMHEVQAIKEYYKSYGQHISHLIVAHTNYRPAINETATKSSWQFEQSKKQFKHFRNRFNSLLYGSKSKRNPAKFQPLILTTIEGTREMADTSKTIHYNICIGNLPNSLTTEDLRVVFTDAWIKSGFNQKSIWIEETGTIQDTENWFGYISKEASNGSTHCFDLTNNQIPTQALRITN